MSRTQDLIVARLRLAAARWSAPPPSDAGHWQRGVGRESAPPDGPAAEEPASTGQLGARPGFGLIVLVAVLALAFGAAMLVRSWPVQPKAGLTVGAPAGSRPASVGPTAAGTAGMEQQPDAGDPFVAGGTGAAGPEPQWGVAASASPSAPASVVVHVAGDVRRPGIVVLPSGSRVGDALAAAGGLRRGGELGAVNLARVVADGERIEVGPQAGPQGPAAEGSGTSVAQGGAAGPVDLNTATSEQLDALPGIGPVTAAKILAWRASHGRFTVVDELAEVPGIGPRTLEELRPLVRV